MADTLGLSDDDFSRVVQTLCEDQLLPASGGRPVHSVIAGTAIDSMLAEVDDPTLQRTVMHLAMAASLADRHLADGEIDLMQMLFQRWQPNRPSASALKLKPH